jgi:hypothetical protein
MPDHPHTALAGRTANSGDIAALAPVLDCLFNGR